MSVKFSENHARYSPLIIESFTITFLLCQKASFVSSMQFSSSRFSIYWKEYFPCISTFFSFTFLLSKKIYSDMIFVFSIFILLHFHPNSGETILQFFISVLQHSLNSFIPSNLQLSINPSSEYHIGALVFLLYQCLPQNNDHSDHV